MQKTWEGKQSHIIKDQTKSKILLTFRPFQFPPTKKCLIVSRVQYRIAPSALVKSLILQIIIGQVIHFKNLAESKKIINSRNLVKNIEQISKKIYSNNLFFLGKNNWRNNILLNIKWTSFSSFKLINKFPYINVITLTTPVNKMGEISMLLIHVTLLISFLAIFAKMFIHNFKDMILIYCTSTHLHIKYFQIFSLYRMKDFRDRR